MELGVMGAEMEEGETEGEWGVVWVAAEMAVVATAQEG